jgi:Rad3-related DNA helicase
MNTCEHCIYFRTEPYYKNEEIKKDVNFGVCTNPKIFSDYVNDHEGREYKVMSIDGINSTCDEERGELIIGKDFGCIHFSKK